MGTGNTKAQLKYRNATIAFVTGLGGPGLTAALQGVHSDILLVPQDVYDAFQLTTDALFNGGALLRTDAGGPNRLTSIGTTLRIPAGSSWLIKQVVTLSSDINLNLPTAGTYYIYLKWNGVTITAVALASATRPEDYPSICIAKVVSNGTALTIDQDASEVDIVTLPSQTRISLEGAALRWEDLRVPCTSVVVGSSPPTLDAFWSTGGLKCYRFSPTTANEVHFVVQLPHSWKEGTDIRPHVHWSPTTGGTGNVRWALEYTWADVNSMFESPTTVYALDASGGSAWTHRLKDFPSMISGSGKKISSALVCRFYRDASHADDTYDGDAALLSFGLRYRVDGFGSKAESTK